VPAFIEPMLPTLANGAPEGDDWVHEVKYDGYRTQLHFDQWGVRAFTRNGHDWTDKYRQIVKDAPRVLKCSSAIIDGEVVLYDKEGRTDFQNLRATISQRQQNLHFVGFDLLYRDGKDLRRVPLSTRLDELFEVVGDYDLRYPFLLSDPLKGSGPDVFRALDEMGLEGMVSKKKSSLYKSGYSKQWLKIKCMAEDEFTVIGIERGEGAATALLAREHVDGLEYVGGAMVTLSNRQRETFWTNVERLETERPPLAIAKRGAQWLKPEMRVRAKFLKGAGKLRHATLCGIVD